MGWRLASIATGRSFNGETASFIGMGHRTGNRNTPRVPYYFTVGMDKTALFIKLDRFICRQRFHRSQPLVDDAGSCFNLLKILSCLFDALSYSFQCVAKLRKLLFDAPQKLPHL